MRAMTRQTEMKKRLSVVKNCGEKSAVQTANPIKISPANTQMTFKSPTSLFISLTSLAAIVILC
jgi:hypothetical protein